MSDDPYWCRVCLEHHVVPSLATIHEAREAQQDRQPPSPQEDEK